LRPGDQLKQLRTRLGITTREVEIYSRKIAESEGNEDFYVSNAWLSQLETKQSIPSIYKLYSLSIIYRRKFTDLLAIFGIDVERSAEHQLSTPLQQTHLISMEVPDSEKPVTFPVRFDRGFSLDKTSLISRMVEIWGEVPVALIQHLDVRHCQYGYIGLQDYTLYPLLRPGSFVQVDESTTRVNVSEWRTEYDRPIYFVELREGYACAWCELRGTTLTLIPHPLSPVGIRQFNYPDEAEVIGQVTGVAMRLVPHLDRHSDASPKLPRRA
jgi:transcriptional regulator with XRE-family HTH domain